MTTTEGGRGRGRGGFESSSMKTQQNTKSVRTKSFIFLCATKIEMNDLKIFNIIVKSEIKTDFGKMSISQKN